MMVCSVSRLSIGKQSKEEVGFSFVLFFFEIKGKREIQKKWERKREELRIEFEVERWLICKKKVKEKGKDVCWVFRKIPEESRLCFVGERRKGKEEEDDTIQLKRRIMS
ncbi:hypothetical protein Ancab_010713 [Ancistrocladus abbreviatus]